MKIIFSGIIILIINTLSVCQTKEDQACFIVGKVVSEEGAVPFANVVLKGGSSGIATDIEGKFTFTKLSPGTCTILCSAIGFDIMKQEVNLVPGRNEVTLILKANQEEIEEVVVTGTMTESYIKDSPIKVQVLSPKFLEKSPANNIMEAVQTVNGVQEQINCGVCGTNDIHINGMEGPYTLVLIDGMPIVSALSSVYGFNGIPNSLIKRVEIVKGPASSLYGTEAVGGVINIITKDPDTTEIASFNTYLTSHGEYNLDAGTSFVLNHRVSTILSANYYYNQQRLDYNNDNFTDIPLNNRLSLFNKWSFVRKQGRKSNVALRYYTENRFGGVMQWTEKDRGSDKVYGESIYTDRIEMIGTYQLPFKERIRVDYSANIHKQNSYYGKTWYNARQAIGFANYVFDKTTEKQEFLVGLTTRYQFYDDNTPATIQAENRFIPGIFIQDELKFDKGTSLLIGGRMDHHKNYGLIPAPRVAFKFKPGNWTTVRLNFGRGFRLVNLFTEDHAALTGSRTVVVVDQLAPEQSYNMNLNLNHVYLIGEHMGTLDADVFFTRFSNKIIPDYLTNPNLIIYDNLEGYAIVRGFSLSVDQNFSRKLKLKLGATYQDVYEVENLTSENSVKNPQLFTPRFSGTFVNTYTMKKHHISVDWTGKVMGRQHLPTYDPPFVRPEVSQVFTIQNLQVTKEFDRVNLQLYFGCKNILNFTQSSPLIDFENPFWDNFDTSYAYGPLQPRRYFVGIRKKLTKNKK